MKINKTIHIPIKIASNPKSGDVICNNWWIVHPEYGVCFYNPLRTFYDGVGSPQCNQDKNVSDILLGRLKLNNGRTYQDEGYEVVKIESVYLGSCLSYAKEQNYH